MQPPMGVEGVFAADTGAGKRGGMCPYVGDVLFCSG